MPKRKKSNWMKKFSFTYNPRLTETKFLFTNTVKEQNDMSKRTKPFKRGKKIKGRDV